MSLCKIVPVALPLLRKQPGVWWHFPSKVGIGTPKHGLVSPSTCCGVYSPKFVNPSTFKFFRLNANAFVNFISSISKEPERYTYWLRKLVVTIVLSKIITSTSNFITFHSTLFFRYYSKKACLEAIRSTDTIHVFSYRTYTGKDEYLPFSQMIINFRAFISKK